MSSSTQQPGSAWRSGGAYDRYMGRWSRQLAPRFVQWLAAPPAQRWLDVGCGTGALAAAIVEHAAPSALTGVDPSAGFLEAAREHLPESVTLRQGSAAAIPLPDAAVDVAVSGLVLNFVPDAVAALREMARVSARGGMVAVYVWDYAQKMEMIRRYWDAALTVDPAAGALHQGERFPLCHPDALAAALAEAGLQNIEGAALELTMRFADFDDYWQPFLGGQGPAPAHAMQLDDAARARVCERLRMTLPRRSDGSIELPARAWAARARVPR
jgi:ubiquinone/menaquinone biosynthesis C-methylase UbiE